MNANQHQNTEHTASDTIAMFVIHNVFLLLFGAKERRFNPPYVKIHIQHISNAWKHYEVCTHLEILKISLIKLQFAVERVEDLRTHFRYWELRNSPVEISLTVDVTIEGKPYVIMFNGGNDDLRPDQRSKEVLKEVQALISAKKEAL